MRRLKQARPVATLGAEIFPTSKPEIAEPAITVLMALGSLARPDDKSPSLLPCRVHNFFRGLPGLWVCMDPNCKELAEDKRDGICGKMYSQPREFCECNARVLEFYTCRNCGSAYARAYTDDLDTPRTLWSKPGRRMRMTDHDASLLRAAQALTALWQERSACRFCFMNIDNVTVPVGRYACKWKATDLDRIHNIERSALTTYLTHPWGVDFREEPTAGAKQM